MRYYTVGGAVRDLLLGRPVRDVDILFDGPEQHFLQEHPEVRKVRETPVPIYFAGDREFTPVSPDGLKADMLRRDFTINALALAQDGILYAHPQALADLAGSVLRPASPSALRDDPVRALRAARLSATFPEFSPHDDTLAQMRALETQSLASIAPEQVGRETLKACSAGKPGNFLRLLGVGQCMRPWFEELAEAYAFPAGPPAFHQDVSVLEHIAMVMDGTARSFFEPESVSCSPVTALQKTKAPYTLEKARSLAVWMALCHDLGKTTTLPEVLPKHIGHEARGEELALALGKRLRLPLLYIKAGALAAKLHMKAGRYHLLRPGTKVDLLMAAHGAHMFVPFFFMDAQDSHNPALPGIAQADLESILAVKLPEERQNMGTLSGEFLRGLRSKALAARP